MILIKSKAIACAVLLVVAAPSQAALVLDDSFSDGDRTDGTDPLDSQWFFLTNIAPDTAAVVGDALTLERTGSTSVGFNPHSVTTFAPQTLGIGDTIILTFNFQSLGGASATGIRFGLYNSGGTNLGNDIAGAPPATGSTFQNDLGYSVFAPHQQVSNVTLYHRPTNSTNNTLQVAAGANTIVVGSGIQGTATDTATVYTASLAINRFNSTSFNLAVNYAGTSFSENYTPAALTDTYDTLSIFGITGQNQAFTIDNVRVEVIPEPSTVAMLGVGMLALIKRQRR